MAEEYRETQPIYQHHANSTAIYQYQAILSISFPSQRAQPISSTRR